LEKTKKLKGPLDAFDKEDYYFFHPTCFSHTLFFFFKITLGLDYIIRTILLEMLGLYNPKSTFTIIQINFGLFYII